MIVFTLGFGLRDNRTRLKLKRHSATSVAARAEIEVACACAEVSGALGYAIEQKFEFHTGLYRARHPKTLDERPVQHYI